MNWNEIEAQWLHMSARLRWHWYRLTIADLKCIAGKRGALISAIEARYGVTREVAEAQVRDWTSRLTTPKPIPPSSTTVRTIPLGRRAERRTSAR